MSDKSQFYNSFLGETKNKFDQARHRKTSSITEQSFFQWTSGHMYRTSYHDMSKKVSAEAESRYSPRLNLKHFDPNSIFFRAILLRGKTW